MKVSSHFELNNPLFYKKTAHIMTLTVLQQLITVGINFFDNIMVGGLGEAAISAASFGNQFYSFFQFVCMGLGSGAIVMSSQFWGRKETDAMRTVTAIAMRVTLSLCAVFTLFSVLSPQLVLQFFTNDPDIITAGRTYVLLIGLTIIPAGLSSTATYLMRSTDNVRIPLIGSLIAFFLNIFFNWVFIFGKLGAPCLGLTGAAIGTMIARLFEFVFVFGYFVLFEENFSFRLRHFLLSGRDLRSQYIRYSVPVLISDTLLGLSLALTTVILGHLGKVISASSAMVGSIVQVLSVLNAGMAGASAVVVGNTIGTGDIARAKREGNSFIVLSFLLGLLTVPLLLALQNPYFRLYDVAGETKALARQMILANCVMQPIQTIAFVISKGILRGGGDTRFLLLADSACVWFISLPLGALGGFVWHIPAIWIYVLLRIEYPLKGLVCLVRYCSGEWIREIKAENPGCSDTSLR